LTKTPARSGAWLGVPKRIEQRAVLVHQEDRHEQIDRSDRVAAFRRRRRVLARRPLRQHAVQLEHAERGHDERQRERDAGRRRHRRRQRQLDDEPGLVHDLGLDDEPELDEHPRLGRDVEGAGRQPSARKPALTSDGEPSGDVRPLVIFLSERPRRLAAPFRRRALDEDAARVVRLLGAQQPRARMPGAPASFSLK